VRLVADPQARAVEEHVLGGQPGEVPADHLLGLARLAGVLGARWQLDCAGQVTGHHQDHDRAEPRRDHRPRVTGAPPAGRSVQPAGTAHTPTVRLASGRGKSPKALAGRLFGRHSSGRVPLPRVLSARCRGPRTGLRTAENPAEQTGAKEYATMTHKNERVLSVA